jgi:hypothetical protein
MSEAITVMIAKIDSALDSRENLAYSVDNSWTRVANLKEVSIDDKKLAAEL